MKKRAGVGLHGVVDVCKEQRALGRLCLGGPLDVDWPAGRPHRPAQVEIAAAP